MGKLTQENSFGINPSTRHRSNHSCAHDAAISQASSDAISQVRKRVITNFHDIGHAPFWPTRLDLAGSPLDRG